VLLPSIHARLPLAEARRVLTEQGKSAAFSGCDLAHTQSAATSYLVWSAKCTGVLVLKGTLMPWNSDDAVFVGALILFMLVAALSWVFIPA
jgi:hypothetical protein